MTNNILVQESLPEQMLSFIVRAPCHSPSTVVVCQLERSLGRTFMLWQVHAHRLSPGFPSGCADFSTYQSLHWVGKSQSSVSFYSVILRPALQVPAVSFSSSSTSGVHASRLQKAGILVQPTRRQHFISQRRLHPQQ